MRKHWFQPLPHVLNIPKIMTSRTLDDVHKLIGQGYRASWPTAL